MVRNIIVAVVENRAREIVIAQMNVENTSTLELHILFDNHSYSQTISMLNTINPTEILLHDGAKNRILSLKIIKECSRLAEQPRILFISRQYFDQNRGADMLKKVVVGEIDSDLISKYTVLAASYCLMRYLENVTNSMFPAQSLRVVYGTGGKDRMIIDTKTAINLEIICNALNKNQKESLFGVINFTKTVVGETLLRSNLLSPSTDLATIETRLDVIEIFLSDSRKINELSALLVRTPDLDKMLNGISLSPKSHTTKTVRVGIDTLIFLRHTLRLLPEFISILSHFKSDDNPLLNIFMENLSSPKFQTLKSTLDDILTDSTTYCKSPDEMRHQECFALRSGINGLLDVARTTFLQCVEDIYLLAQDYSKTFNISVKATFRPARGYYLQIPSAIENLPVDFIRCVLNKSTISCTTDEVSSLSDRASESITMALNLTNELIQNVLDEVRNHIEEIFAVVDSIALLDMLISFVDMISLNPGLYSRPKMRNDGPLVLDHVRHPVISTIQRNQYVENSLFMNSLQNFLVITGPNGSGKSTFIKQTALVVILAQIGCFIPGHKSIIPIRDRILSRIGTDDDTENNLSSFQVEMKEVSALIDTMTEKSLIIIDELGRGTSNIEGISLAFAIAEYLQANESFTLFVTHFSQLTSLADLYPNVKNIHFKTKLTHSTSSNLIEYLHMVGDGPCDIKCGYGIQMAKSCGIPDDLIHQSQLFLRKITQISPMLLKTKVVHVPFEFAFSVLNRLDLLTDSSCDTVGLREYLSSLREKLTKNEISYFHHMFSTSFPLDSPSLAVVHNNAASPINISLLSNMNDNYPIISPRDGKNSPNEENLTQLSPQPRADDEIPIFNNFILNRKRKNT